MSTKPKPMSSKSRARAANYSTREKIGFIKIMKNYSKIIDCKKTDAVSSDEKKNAWEEVTIEFNKSSENWQRSQESLQGLWTNLKKDTRKYLANQKKENLITGGGSNEFETNPVYVEMLKVISPLIQSLDNPYDSNNDPDSVGKLLCEAESANPLDDDKALYKLLEGAGYFNNWKKWSKKKVKKEVSAPLNDIRMKVLTNEVCTSKKIDLKEEMKSTPDNEEQVNSQNVDDVEGLEGWDSELYHNDMDDQREIPERDEPSLGPQSMEEKEDFSDEKVIHVKKEVGMHITAPLGEIAARDLNCNITTYQDKGELLTNDEKLITEELTRQKLKRVRLKNELLDLKLQKKRFKLQMLEEIYEEREESSDDKEN